MSKVDRAKLRDLESEATSGEWVTFGDTVGTYIGGCTCGAGGLYPHEQYCGVEGPLTVGASKEDAVFIAAARNALPALLDALDAAQALLAAPWTCMCDDPAQVIHVSALRKALAGVLDA